MPIVAMRGRLVLTIEDVEKAREVLRGITVQTPLLVSDRLSQESGGHVYIKAENTQQSGSFKLRGA